MAKKIKKNSITKESGEINKGSQLVVSELNIMSADASRKDIGTYRQAKEAAKSKWHPNRTRLYDMYEDIMDDGHLTGIVSKRISNVLNKGIYFENAAGKRVEEMDDLIESKAFRKMVTKILEAKMWGISGMQFHPGEEFNFEEIPRKHIKPKKKVISHEQNDVDGISYDGVSNIWIIGETDDLGLLLKCSPYALYKRGNMGDWAQYVEIFGQPVRIIYYDAYDTKTKMELRQVLDESGSSLALMIPKQAQFEMKDGKQSNGDGQLQEKFKLALDSEMSIIILGNTETTTSSKSSGYAQSETHGKQQNEIIKDDLKDVNSELNSKHFLNILKSFGYPVEGGRFKYEKEIDLTALKLRLEIDKVVSEKTPVGDDYWYETYGIPKPDNYDELIKKKEAVAAAIQGGNKDDDEDDDEVVDDKAKDKTPAKKPIKKKLKASNFWVLLRAQLADFFYQAPLK